MLSAICVGLLAPSITEVILSSFNTHASAIWANDWFLPAATLFSSFTFLTLSSVICDSVMAPFLRWRPALESAGIPFRYLSVSSPCARDEKVIQPIFFFSYHIQQTVFDPTIKHIISWQNKQAWRA